MLFFENWDDRYILPMKKTATKSARFTFWPAKKKINRRYFSPKFLFTRFWVSLAIKTHRYTNIPRFFSGESHTVCFFPNRDSIFRHQKNTLNRSILCGIIGRALLLFLLLLLFRIGKLPIDRGNGNGIGGKKKKWLRIAARRNRSQFPILLFLDCCLILYGTVYDVYLFIQQQEREGAKERHWIYHLLKKNLTRVFLGCVQQQNSETSWLTRTTNSPNFCQRVNLWWRRRTKGAHF